MRENTATEASTRYLESVKNGINSILNSIWSCQISIVLHFELSLVGEADANEI